MFPLILLQPVNKILHGLSKIKMRSFRCRSNSNEIKPIMKMSRNAAVVYNQEAFNQTCRSQTIQRKKELLFIVLFTTIALVVTMLFCLSAVAL